MSVILATDDTYEALVRSPGWTLVVYEHDGPYRDQERMRRDVRKIAAENVGRLRVVVAWRDSCPAAFREPHGAPGYVLYRDGERVGGFGSPKNHRRVRDWLRKVYPNLADGAGATSGWKIRYSS